MGRSVTVTGIPADGSAKTVEFPLRTVSLGALPGPRRHRAEPGLSELEVYAIPDPAGRAGERDGHP